MSELDILILRQACDDRNGVAVRRSGPAVRMGATCYPGARLASRRTDAPARECVNGKLYGRQLPIL